MSMSTDCYYGYGFNTNAIDRTKVVLFVKNHADALNELGESELIEGINDADFDFYEYQIDANNGYSCDSFNNLVANIMTVENNVHFSVYENEIGDSVIIFEAMEPWKYTAEELALSEQALIDMVRKYAFELGVSEDDIDYLKIEVWG